MKQRRSLESKNLTLTMADTEHASLVFKALGSQERLRIIELLAAGSMHVKEIARAADLPVSTAAAHVRLLEDAGILMSESVPGVHGAIKLCSRRLDHVGITLRADPVSNTSTIALELPVGAFSRVYGIEPTCGLAAFTSPIGENDNPLSFYSPERINAQLVWFRHGFIEFRFGMISLHSIDISSLELSFEACSEAPMYRNPWKSDIELFINDQYIGTWTSPADMGGRKGKLNPEWWPDTMTQYGQLVTWRIDNKGSYVNNAQVSDHRADELDLRGRDHILVRIGVDKQAANPGGMNLFGEKFGDFAQGIILRVGYEPIKTE